MTIIPRFTYHADASCTDMAAFTQIPEATIKALATHGLPPVEEFQIKSSGRPDGLFEVIYRGAGFSDKYSLSFEDRQVGQGFVKNHRHDRTTGRTMFANRAVVGLALGMDAVSLQASELMGAYSWPKAGVYVDEDDIGRLSHDLRYRARLLEPYLDTDAANIVHDLCELREPQSLWAVADLWWPLNIDKTDFDRAQRYTNGLYTLAEYQQEGFLKNGMTAGHFLLCGLSYKARIHLHDAMQMDTLEMYSRVEVRDIARGVIQPPQPDRVIQPTRYAEYSSNPPSRMVLRR